MINYCEINYISFAILCAFSIVWFDSFLIRKVRHQYVLAYRRHIRLGLHELMYPAYFRGALSEASSEVGVPLARVRGSRGTRGNNSSPWEDARARTALSLTSCAQSRGGRCETRVARGRGILSGIRTTRRRCFLCVRAQCLWKRQVVTRDSCAESDTERRFTPTPSLLSDGEFRARRWLQLIKIRAAALPASRNMASMFVEMGTVRPERG